MAEYNINKFSAKISQNMENKNPDAKERAKIEKMLNEAKERIKQKIIAADESLDKTVRYAAITKFSKNNE